MVRDDHDDLIGPVPAPQSFRRPADAPPPIPRARDTEAARRFHHVWTAHTASGRSSLRARAARLSGRSNRRLVVALSGATEALLAQCDVLADRLEAVEAVAADVGGALGADLTRLRAEVLELRRQVARAAGTADG